MENRITVLDKTLLHATRWLQLIDRNYRTRTGEHKAWSYIERIGNREAVVVVPRTRDGRLLLIRQFRVPFAADVIEFPAGLIDDGETPQQAALRELREETGFSGTVTGCTGPDCTSPGLTTETIYTVTALIGDRPVTEKSPEASEQIEEMLVSPEAAPALLDRLAAQGCIIDTKVRLLLAGMLLSGSQPPA